ncbi:uncharacterized protein CMC5_038000 [Chondromyces crocatus]|uniref:Uncharacterized protein n=2 Tax=Chondromyces crocatus TaxID=52 RepID=A0A0K1EFL0_CHOCO|nr:uncharacterized protein CMC5_038000 [Chondromyces crocatus]
MLALPLLCCALVGCGARNDLLGVLEGEEPPGGEGAGGPGPSSGPGATQPNPTGPFPEPEPPPVCDDSAEPIYVLASNGRVYHFWPVERRLDFVGQIPCLTFGGPRLPNTMTISRDGYMLVNALNNGTEGWVTRVELSNLSCSADELRLTNDATQIGMTFLRGRQDEPLFTLGLRTSTGDQSSTGLARLEFPGGVRTVVGQVGAPFTFEDGDLRSTGGGRLFGFYRTSPLQLVEIDPNSGAVLGSFVLPGLMLPSAWAIASWGGDFYLFTADPVGAQVSRFRPSDGSFEKDYLPNLQISAVGADALTCAR